MCAEQDLHTFISTIKLIKNNMTAKGEQNVRANFMVLHFNILVWTVMGILLMYILYIYRWFCNRFNVSYTYDIDDETNILIFHVHGISYILSIFLDNPENSDGLQIHCLHYGHAWRQAC